MIDATNLESVHNVEITCSAAIEQVHAFLHGELPEDQADIIREHLMACESCMDNFDVEVFITKTLRRCLGNSSHAPAQLRTRVSLMHVRWDVN